MKPFLPIEYVEDNKALSADKVWRGMPIRKMNRDELLATINDLMERLERHEDLLQLEKLVISLGDY